MPFTVLLAIFVFCVLKYQPIIQPISSSLFDEKGVNVSVLRLDLLHEKISGNKWFKLKRNLEEAGNLGFDTILTFGGAFSNHIHATAAACAVAGFKSIGVIRGEPNSVNNPTLSEAKKMGMQLHFVSRDVYRKKNEEDFIKALQRQFGEFYLIPEGGNNLFGALGCADILENIPVFNYVFCACGTATTFSGLAKTISDKQILIGVSVLKGEQSMVADAQQIINQLKGNSDFVVHNNDVVLGDPIIARSGIINEYVFGGYAKHSEQLLNFKYCFESRYNIPLDYVYTSKLFYAVFDLVKKNRIRRGSTILILHSGGLQGNKGYENRYALNPMRIVTDPHGKDCFGLMPRPIGEESTLT